MRVDAPAVYAPIMTALVLASAAPTVAPAVDVVALNALVARAQELDSDALVVMKEGVVVAERWFDGKPRRIETMSMTKSVVALAVGRLVTTGKLASVDVPVATWFPEWKQGRKQNITVRHLLEQTSGLQADSDTREIYPAPDFVQLALCAELTSEPGATFFYNNKATNLLAGVVERVSGMKLDAYVKRELFAPLGITDVRWTRDRAGNAHAMSGLQLRPIDVAKLAQLMLDEGRWRGAQLLDAAWVQQATAPSKANKRHGQLWWLLPDVKITIDDAAIDAWRKGGADPEFIAAMQPLKGRVLGHDLRSALDEALKDMGGAAAWDRNTWQKGLPDGTFVSANVAGFAANGWQGQHVVVWQQERIVVVRMREPKDNDDAENKRYGFFELPQMARALQAPSSGGSSALSSGR